MSGHWLALIHRVESCSQASKSSLGSSCFHQESQLHVQGLASKDRVQDDQQDEATWPLPQGPCASGNSGAQHLPRSSCVFPVPPSAKRRKDIKWYLIISDHIRSWPASGTLFIRFLHIFSTSAARYIKVPVPGKPKIVVQEEPYDVQMPPEAAPWGRGCLDIQWIIMMCIYI